MLLHWSSTKNYKMISQLCYKQMSKTFSLSTKRWCMINDMSNKFGSTTTNICIFFCLIRHSHSISRTWQTVFAKSSWMKSYLVAKVLANIIPIILFLGVYCIVNALSQKRFFNKKDEEIIKFFLCFWKNLLFSWYFAIVYSCACYFCDWYCLCNTLEIISRCIS